MKKILATMAALILFSSLVAQASAANESIDLSLEARPVHGSLYREVSRPVSASLTVKVDVPEGEPRLTPMVTSNVTFPSDMSFHPHPSQTPVCPEDKVGPQSSLSSGVAAMVRLCPRSVIGTGVATVQAGQSTASFATLDDAQLVTFNAGRNEDGRPRITIYGYSKLANSGVFMTGVLAANGELRIEIGQLAYDSSVATFTLGIPGTPLVPNEAPESDPIRGMDPAYLQAKCATGEWSATGAFTLGSRDPSTGEPVGEPRLLHSNPVSLPCQGAAGKAKLAFVGLPRSKRMKPGKSSVLALRLKNSGTATARSIRISATGAAKGSAGLKKLAPGASRTIKLRVRAGGKGSGRLRLKLKGRGTTPKHASIRIEHG